MRASALRIAKWSWVLAVCTAGAIYASQHSEELIAQLQSVPGVRLGLCLGLLILGKLFLVLLSRRSIQVPAWKPSYGEMFFISATTQVAKYLPGGVWHFVGRAGAYRGKGMSLEESGRALFVENVWLSISGFGFGFVFFLPFGVPSTFPRWAVVVGLVLVGLCWWAGLWVLDRLHRPKATDRLSWSSRLVGLQCLVWLSLGSSFWVLLPAASNAQGFLVSVGAFAVSWLVGFLMVFAPGGLGVREAVLGGLMSSLSLSEQSVFYAVVHRLLWVTAELLLAALATSVSEMRPTRSPVSREEAASR